MSLVLRGHQREVVKLCADILNGKPVKEVVIACTPGGGKSFAPVILAENLIPAVAEKICWVVPRNSLKYQGEGEFCDPRWMTSKRLRAAENGGDLSRGLAGYITTYQAVGQNPECHAAEFSKHKYILFLDEFHHVADGSEWHKALSPLVKNAALVVLASGTLSRGDGERIAFIGYVNGEPFLDNLATRRVITYSRSAAIADGAILPVRFNLVDGGAEWEETDGGRNTSRLSGEESAKALFTALRTEFANHLLEAAFEEYFKIKKKYPNAKILIVAPNIEIAKAYYDYVYVRGQNPRIATSENTPQARKNIEDFKGSDCDVLITVAMAYEGLNVPEISVICCLSHIRSVPWLEQCFARANRKAPGKTDAVVYAPADWAFKEAALMIEREQLTPLNTSEGRGELAEAGGGKDAEGEGGGARPWIIPIGSSADIGGTAPAVSTEEIPPCSPSEAEKILRKNINKTIQMFLDGVPHGGKLAHSKMLYRRVRLVCGKPVAEMNQGELEKVWMWVRKEYGTEGEKK